MNELDGQALLVVLMLGEDAVELGDWEVMALHEESMAESDRLPDQQSVNRLCNGTGIGAA